MSSSRRSSRSERAGRCPTCGSTKVARVVEDVSLKVRRKTFRFEAVEHERCFACGERIFDLETSRSFDAAILRRRRSPAA
jgi:YgiT-type zinc finger domain-containing protein